MIYLIGGPARCGKSTLARLVREKIDGQVLSGDAFVHALQGNLKPQWVPDIFDHAAATVMNAVGPRAKINRLRRRDEAMWQFYEAYFKASVLDAPGEDILLEGNIWPDFLELFSIPHKVVFLIDTSSNQMERLITIRDGSSNNNWMHDFTDERLAEWAIFNAARSERYKSLCLQLSYQYFDIADYGIERAEQYAFEYLLDGSIMKAQA